MVNVTKINVNHTIGSFHLVHILLDEYTFLVFETQEEQETEKALQKNVQQHMKNAGNAYNILYNNA